MAEIVLLKKGRLSLNATLLNCLRGAIAQRKFEGAASRSVGLPRSNNFADVIDGTIAELF
jgi:hypothetical protein